MTGARRSLPWIAVLLWLGLSGFLNIAGATPRDSLDYAAFARELRKVLTDEQARSIISQLPPKCKIYGFDIGDISGDDRPDLVLSMKTDEDRSREVTVALFLATGEGFEQVQTLKRAYLSEPIEVGFSIDQGTCSVTQKIEEFHWEIVSYAVPNRIFRRTATWSTQRLRTRAGLTNVGFETQDNHLTNRTREVYYQASDTRTIHKAEFCLLPVLPRQVKCPPDVNRYAGGESMRTVLRGSSSWSGWDDCRLTVSGSYDEHTLSITAEIRDDILLGQVSTSQPDRLDLWFDASGLGKVNSSGKVRKSDPDNLLHVSISMGDGKTEFSELSVLRRPPEKSRDRIPSVKHTFDVVEPGLYRLTVHIPRALLREPFLDRFMGFAAVYYDSDNVEHPDWITVLSTSDAFEEGNPSSFGRLEYHSTGDLEYEREDLRARILASRLVEAGFKP